MSRVRKRTAAFTLVELLVVIGIIGLLVGILLPTFARARDSARIASCAANLRQISQAWLAYAVDHRGAIVSSNTHPQGWVDSGQTESAVKRGLLYKYLKDTQVYRCKSDPEKNDFRTYSLNAFLNGEGNPGAKHMRQIRSASQTFLGIEEYDPRGFNINSFMVPPTGDSWVDFPGTWHLWGCNLSFCDGRVEYWTWTQQETRSIQTFYANTPNNPDLKRLQAVSLN